jgi:hypothetical protein
MQIPFALVFALHVAAVAEQNWVQASDFTRSSFMQDAQAFIANFDAEDSSEDSSAASAEAPRSQRSNLRRAADHSLESRGHAGRGSAGLIQFHGAATSVSHLRQKTQKKAALQTAAAGAISAQSALSSELAAAKVEAARAAATARAEQASSTRLKTELTKSIRSQYSLRMRLKEVGTEAHERLAQLLKQLEVAKAAARRSELLLRSEIKKEAAKLKVAEESEIKLRNQLAAAETASITASRGAAAAAAKEAAATKEYQRTARKSTEQLKHMQQASAKETRLLREELKQEQQADAKVQSKLKEQIGALQKAASKERLQLESQIKDAQRATEKVQDDLEAEKLSEKLLQANITRTQQSAEISAAETRKERMGLLVQVSELQEQSSTAQKKAAAAAQAAEVVKQKAQEQLKEEAAAAKHQEVERQHRISALLQETQAAHANLTAAATAATAARHQVAALQAALSKKEEQLRVGMLESNDLRAARDIATKGEATFQRMDLAAEASLKEVRQEMSLTRNELQEVKIQLASRVKDADSLSTKCKGLEARLASLKKSTAASEARVNQEMHETMLSATSKVRELQEQNDQFNAELKKEKKALELAKEESAKAKDTLMQETDASLRDSQRADNLQTVLQQAQKDADANEQRSAELTRQVEALKEERDRAKEAITRSSSTQADLATKAETLEASRKSQQTKVLQVEAENKKMKAQVHDLTGEEQRGDELEEELVGLRQTMQRKNSEEAQMAKNLEMLRSLKDHYSTEYESSKNETDVWHQKVEDIEADLKKTKQQLESRTKSLEKAKGRAKEARSQEDEYFEENSRLDQQDEALNAKLNEVTSAANSSQAENKRLRQRVEDLKTEETREKANSHAAWVENESQLMQARRDLKLSERVNENLQAEIQRTQAMLSDKEWQTLGLPPRKKAAKGQAAPKVATSAASSHEAPPPPAPVKPAAQPAAAEHKPTAAVVPLAEGTETGPVAEPLTPQVGHVKVWEPTDVAAKPPAKKLRASQHKHTLPAVAQDKQDTPSQPVVPAAPKPRDPSPPSSPLPVKAAVVAKVEKAAPTQALLPGEPQKPNDDAVATLASVTAPKPATSRSALQKLADFFSSPLQR